MKNVFSHVYGYQDDLDGNKITSCALEHITAALNQSDRSSRPVDP